MNSIKRLAQGLFVQAPKILSMTKELSEEAELGNDVQFKIHIKADGPLEVKAFSTDMRVKLLSARQEDTGKGVNVTIDLTVNTHGEKEGTRIQSEVILSTNAGEFKIPCTFTVTKPYPTFEGQKIKDLSRFASLAQDASETAADLFADERFTSLLEEGSREDLLRETLLSQSDKRLALEEFLSATALKPAVKLEASCTQETVSVTGEQTLSIQLKLVQPGYAKIYIRPDDSFLTCSVQELSTDRFENGILDIPVVLHAKKMHGGLNFAKIWIEYAGRILPLEIRAKLSGARVRSAQEDKEHSEKRLFMTRLTEEYLLHSTGRTSDAEWKKTAETIISARLASDPEDLGAKLADIKLLADTGRREEAGHRLQLLQLRLEKEYADRSLLYYFSLYVLSAANDSEDFRGEVAAALSAAYEKGQNAWQMLWILFRFKDQMRLNSSLWLTRMKDAFARGCHSPLLYLDALGLLNADPLLLRVLNTFERQVIYFGCRNNCVSEELALQAVELTRRTSSVDPADEKMLLALNKVFDDDRILSGCVSLLIREGKRGETWFPYYEKAVLRGLNITRLFEYYAMSMGEKKEIRVPKSVLLYFKFGCQSLDAASTARIYRYVLANVSGEILEEYRENILSFAEYQLKQGNISADLADCYLYLYKSGTMNPSLASAFFRAVSSCRVHISDTSAVSLVLKMKELEREYRIPLIGGEAFIPVFSDHFAFVFEDGFGKRRIGSENYEFEALFPDFRLSENDQLLCLSDPLYQICFFDQHAQEKESEETIASFSGTLLNNTAISAWEKQQLYAWRIAYEDQYDKIPDMPDTPLPLSLAQTVIRLFVRHDYYTEALEMTKRYTAAGMDAGTVLGLASGCLTAEQIDTEPAAAADLCLYAFNGGCFNERTLAYLQSYAQGSEAQLYEIFKACRENNISARELEERLIGQMLTTHSTQPFLGEVFAVYYRHAGDTQMTRAFLNSQAYDYFVQDKQVHSSAFAAARDLLRKNIYVSDLSASALLKHDAKAQFKGLDQEDKRQDQELLNALIQKGRSFAFLGDLGTTLVLPPSVSDKTVAEYRSQSGRDVKLKYSITDIRGHRGKEEQIRVKEQLAGVYSAAFILLPGEMLTGTFFDTAADGTVTQSPLKLTRRVSQGESGRFALLCEAFDAWQKHDTGKMKSSLRAILENDYVSRELFTVLPQEGGNDGK